MLVRADSGGGTHGFLEWLTAKSRRLHYSVGITITEDMQEAILKVPVGRLVRGRRLRLRLAHQRPWAIEITAAVTRLQAMPSG